MSNITYTRVGDYLLPNIILGDTGKESLGYYGRMHKDFLREHRPILYNQLLLSERLYPLCREVDATATARLERTSTENKQSAVESILAELVYC